VEVNTRRLRHFVTLADELHFTRAAAKLHVSQQGLSHSIGELERLVGASLVQRTTRSVALTEAGKAFLPGARTALASLASAAEAARTADGAIAGTLRVGFTVSSALELTSPILRAFHERHPTVDLELDTYQWDDPSCGLRPGATDVAFVRTPIDCPNVRTERLFVEPRAIGVDESHRLADARSVTLDDLVGERIMAPRTADPAWLRFWTLRDTGRPEEALPHVDRTAGSMEEELDAVAAGLAITVTAICMSRFTPRPSITFRPITDAAGTELALGWRGAGTSLTNAFRAVTLEVRDRERALVERIERATGVPSEF
jgi:DNA-binding transcriptional LysR family regulator